MRIVKSRRTLPFFKRVQCSAKNLLNIFAFVYVSITSLSFIKRGEIKGIFLLLEKDLRIAQ